MKIIHSIFKTFLLSLLVFAQVHFAYAQTASILPPAKTTFVDQNGKPLTSGTVDFYIPSTTTRKTTWQDTAETIPNTNPVVLDAAGRALILGSGNYRQIVKDRLGNLIWDQVTSSTGSGSTPTVSTGDGDLVGTIKPWAGMTAPNQYMFAYGEELSRTTYAALFTAITSTQAVFCTSGSAILSGLSDTTNFPIGAKVEISCVVAGSSTIVSKTSSSITLAANSNVNTNTSAIIYPWGNGNGTTTFNVPDFRGFVIAGNNNMGGVASSVLTTTFFGSANPNSIGAAGGNQSATLLTTNLPPYTPSGTIANGAITITNNATAVGGGGVGFGGSGNLAVSATITASQATSTFTGTAAAGQNSTPLSLIQPTKTSNFIIKVIPDANSATASGVTDINGMTGSIGCGINVTCTGNIISVNSPPPTSTFCSTSPTICAGIFGYADITWWGAIGDGNISNAAINISATTSALATGLCVLIPNANAAGGFNYGTNTITISSNQCIKAENDALVLYTGNSDFIAMSSFDKRTDLSGLFIEMNGAGSLSNAIRLKTSLGVVFRPRISHITVQNAFSCIADESSNYVTDLILSDIVCQKPKGTQFLFQHSRGFFVLTNVNLDGSQQVSPVITYPLAVFQDYAGIQALDFSCSGQVAVILANGGTPSFQANTPCMKFTSTATQAFLDLNRTFVESSQGAGIQILASGAFQAKISLTDITAQSSLGNQIDIENAAVSVWNNVIAIGAVGITGAASNAHGIICISCSDIQGTVWRSYNNTGDGFLFTNSTGIVVSVAESGGNTLWGILENGTSNNNSINQIVYGTNGSGNLSQVGSASNFSTAGTQVSIAYPYTVGDIYCATTTLLISRLADIAVNNVLLSGGVGACPTYGKVSNAALANSTISGIALGSNLNTLTFGTHLVTGGSSYNGSAGVTITSDATNANTSSTIVARDGSGNFSAGTLTLTSVIFNPTTSGTTGTTTNDSATTGIVGEYVQGVIPLGSAIGTVSNTPGNLTSVSLTAGDWDVNANFCYNGGGTTVIANIIGSISLSSATLDFTNGRGAGISPNAADFGNITSAQCLNIVVGPVRFSLSGTTSIFAVYSSIFSVSTETVYGILRARRIR